MKTFFDRLTAAKDACHDRCIEQGFSPDDQPQLDFVPPGCVQLYRAVWHLWNRTPAGPLPKLTPQESADLEHRQLVSKLMRLVAINAYAAYFNTLVGDPAPCVREQYERTTNAMPGDVVLETSTVWRWAHRWDEAPKNQYPGLGVLLRVVMEPVATQEELDKLHADGDCYKSLDESLDDLPKEKVVYIAPLDGSVPEYRWTNADFIRVLSSLEDTR